jgi:hypothetical protein
MIRAAAGAAFGHAHPEMDRWPMFGAIGLLAGSVIALQITIMRIFAVGSWAHFGSLVVSLAMLGFGLASVVIFLMADWLDRHWRGAASTALVLVGPLAVGAEMVAQIVPFNAIFIISDPAQKYRLLANFLLYLLPFLAGAFFLGIVFRRAQERFSRVYFADLTGSGLAGIFILGAMYLLPPESLMLAPLLLWGFAGLCWFGMARRWQPVAGMALLIAATMGAYLVGPAVLGIPDIAVSQYKGVAYARNFPDGHRIYRNISPFGDLQIYASSFMHFAPGLSDNAAFNVPEVPPNTYVGMYIDGEGPEGIMRELPPADSAYFRYLPMYYPYVIKQHPSTFVVQFGGGISTVTALNAGARSVTVAESNPAVIQAFEAPEMKAATAGVINDPRVHVVDYDGRLFLAHTARRFDVIDLSLADSVGLSNPGGFAVVEKYPYTVEAMVDYMRALADGGVLSITVWNKEEPPKSVFKLYTTVAEAARQLGGDPAKSLFVTSSYLSTSTVLYKRGGFTPAEVARLRDQTQALSFDEIYSPGYPFDPKESAGILEQYRQSIFGNGSPGADAGTAAAPGTPDPTGPAAGASEPAGPQAGAVDPTGGDGGDNSGDVSVMPSTALARLLWHDLIYGGSQVGDKYVFDTKPLTNDRPYFAAYERPGDLDKTLDRLDLFQDDWGYLLVWATLGIAAILAASLVVIPLLFGWSGGFHRTPGKLGTIIYFGCLGIGYIMVEVGLISRFTLALSNPTISSSVLISALLVFSGLGSLLAERILDRARLLLPLIFAVIAVLLIGYGLFLSPVLDWIGAFAYGWRLVLSFLVIAPPAFLMGFPMATAMTTLARLDKKQMFVWAWGINGCASVIGAAAVPLIATNFGLAMVLEVSAIAYLVAVPAFFSVARPAKHAARPVLAS